MKSLPLIACSKCDLLHRLKPLPEGSEARCIRCGALLYAQKKNTFNRTLSLTIAGLILFIIANAFPLIGIQKEGLVQRTTLFGGVATLYAEKNMILAVLVFLTCILVPVLQLSGIFYVMLPLKFHRRSWFSEPVFRSVRKMQPWGMMEVFMLGILVAIVKLAKIASILPGISLYAFAALIFVLAAISVSIDPHAIWQSLGEKNG